MKTDIELLGLKIQELHGPSTGHGTSRASASSDESLDGTFQSETHVPNMAFKASCPAAGRENERRARRGEGERGSCPAAQVNREREREDRSAPDRASRTLFFLT